MAEYKIIKQSTCEACSGNSVWENPAWTAYHEANPVPLSEVKTMQWFLERDLISPTFDLGDNQETVISFNFPDSELSCEKCGGRGWAETEVAKSFDIVELAESILSKATICPRCDNGWITQDCWIKWGEANVDGCLNNRLETENWFAENYLDLCLDGGGYYILPPDKIHCPECDGHGFVETEVESELGALVKRITDGYQLHGEHWLKSIAVLLKNVTVLR